MTDVEKNCPSGKTATRNPSNIYPNPIDVSGDNKKNCEEGFAKSCGIIGIKIPKPNISRNTVKNKKKRLLLFFCSNIGFSNGSTVTKLCRFKNSTI